MAAPPCPANLADTPTVYRDGGDFFTLKMFKHGSGFPMKDRYGAPQNFGNPLSLRINRDPTEKGRHEQKPGRDRKAI